MEKKIKFKVNLNYEIEYDSTKDYSFFLEDEYGEKGAKKLCEAIIINKINSAASYINNVFHMPSEITYNIEEIKDEN